MPRPWTGKGPLLSKKEKERKKKIRLFEPLDGRAEAGRVFEMARSPGQLGRYSKTEMSREEVLGEPLSRAEVRELVRPNLSNNRQVNLGRDGLTHNMLELVHTHWRRQEVCKVRCRGVPTVDMDNVCHHLEEKTGGKIIYRTGGLVYLFRGRNYNPHTRPKYPVMLWKPAAPVYPKLIQEAPEGLTKAEADEMRKKGQSLLPICKLAKNGIYLTLVKDVRDAFEGSHLAKINCEGMHASDYKKIGAKLKELVPCVLLSFDNEQILMWRGNNWKSMYPPIYPSVSKLLIRDKNVSSDLKSPGKKTEISNSRMQKLWKHAVDSGKALVLDEPDLSPDSILERVEEFEGVSQASEHSYPALILSSEGESDVLDAGYEDRSEIEIGIDDFSSSDSEDDEDYDDEGDLLGDVESSVPIGSLPVDSIAERLSQEW